MLMRRFLMGCIYSAACVLILAVGGVSASSAIAAPRAIGVAHSGGTGCAVMANHSVECWGRGDHGQLGNGRAGISLTPVHVTGIRNAVSVTVGDDHACALLSTGRVKCWGNNTEGELGDGTTLERHTPVFVSGILHASKVATGYRHTCAVTTIGAMKCWGANNTGAIGDGTTHQRLRPTQVRGLIRHVTWISVGYYATCAVQSGVASCWGQNDSGQLGDGSAVSVRHLPRRVARLGSHTMRISLGSRHACALVATPSLGGAAFCWGDNADGELGIGTTGGERHSPLKVKGMQTHVTGIATGTNYSCAIQSGAVKCWGANDSGQLGDGTKTERHLPRGTVGMKRGTSSIATGYGTACGRRITGGVSCWGYGSGGELGNGTHLSRLVASRVHLI